MTDQEVRDETKKIKRKLDSIMEKNGLFSSIRAQWSLAKYQNMAEECIKRGISPGV